MKDINYYLILLKEKSINYHYYKRYYDFIMSRNPYFLNDEDYFESHHILPKSYGGSDEKSNLIKLTAREHFIAHWLLWKACDTKMQRAFHMISHTRNSECSKIKSSRVYSKLREETSKNHNWRSNPNHPNYKRDMKGENNGMYGRKHSETSKKSMSNKHKGKTLSQETRNKMSLSTSGSLNPMFGKTGNKHPAWGLRRTEEQLKKMSEKSSGKNNPMARKISIDGKEYDTIREASDILGIPTSTVRQRLNSNGIKFKDWIYKT